jgi:Uma2 family endonuclease
MTAEDYLAWERNQLDKHEFHDGEIFAMAGGSVRHNALCEAVGGELYVALRGGECRSLSSDQRVSLQQRKRYVYPDVTVVCGRVQIEEGTSDVVTNPKIIVEVLSRSTEAYDRGEKWEGYRQIDSLDDYVLVSQKAATVEHYQRQADGSWRYSVAGPGKRVTVTRGIEIEVDRLYHGAFELPGDEEGVEVGLPQRE